MLLVLGGYQALHIAVYSDVLQFSFLTLVTEQMPLEDWGKYLTVSDHTPSIKLTFP